MESRKRGLDAFVRGDFSAAVQWLQHRAAVAPNDIEVRCKLGWALSQCGHHAEAIAVIARIIAERPAQAEVHFYRGMVLGRANRLYEAADALKTTLHLQPSHAQAAAWLAWIQGELHRNAGRSVAAPPPAAPGSKRAWGVLSLPYLGAFLFRYFLPTALLGLLGAVFLVLHGWHLQNQAREFKAPIVLSYDEFVRQKPRKGWFIIRQCQLEVVESIFHYFRRQEGIATCYVPIRRLGAADTEPVQLMLEAHDPAVRKSVEIVSSFIRRGDERGLIAYAQQYPDQFLVFRDVEGVIETGIDAVAANPERMRTLSPELASDLIILDEGAPDLKKGEGEVQFGIRLFLTILVLLAIPMTAWFWGLSRQGAT